MKIESRKRQKQNSPRPASCASASTSAISSSSTRIRRPANCAASCRTSRRNSRGAWARTAELVSYPGAGQVADGAQRWRLGRRLHRRRTAARRGDRIHARLPRDSRHLPGARGLADPQSRRGRPAGVRIATAARSAYDLYLSRSLKHAQLVRAEGIPASYDLFVKEKLDVLSGLLPRLTSDVSAPAGCAHPGREVHRHPAGDRHAEGAHRGGGLSARIRRRHQGLGTGRATDRQARRQGRERRAPSGSSSAPAPSRTASRRARSSRARRPAPST